MLVLLAHNIYQTFPGEFFSEAKGLRHDYRLDLKLRTRREMGSTFRI